MSCSVCCLYDNCKLTKLLNDGYCKIHSKIIFEEYIDKNNKKMCTNHIRGCRSILELNYNKSRCEECLIKDREKDKIKRDYAKTIQSIREIIINNNKDDVINVKLCSVCCKNHPLDFYNGVKGETKTCKICREQNKKCDEKRDKEHRRELERKNSKKPENIEIKKKWKENNYDKVAGAWMKYRQNKLNTLGTEEYLKQNAEQAKKWRDNNPEKNKENNLIKSNNLYVNYNIYKRSADDKNFNFELSFDEYSNIVKNICRYCGILHERGFNGIDRINSKFGYTIENSVSCCKMCNYMKQSLSETVFIKCVEHILTFNNLIENGNLYPKYFANYKGSTFEKYKYRANIKNIKFEINEILFDKIRNDNCYICGKSSNQIHKNGIDRFDNTLGYIDGNVKPCCGNCNYMKRNYIYEGFINKLKEIYTHSNLKEEHNTIVEVDDSIFEVDDSIVEVDDSIVEVKIQNIVKGNKKTKEEKNEIERLRTAKKREELKKRYNDEEYKKLRANEIAEYRKTRLIDETKREELREKEKIRKIKYRESLKV
jgi:hypothetical protein